MQINSCDSSKFSFLRPVGGILFLHIKEDTNIQHISNQFVRKVSAFSTVPIIVLIFNEAGKRPAMQHEHCFHALIAR